jgi:nitric oxide reductase NorD protein
MSDKPFQIDKIEEKLDEYLDAVLSSRRSAHGLAYALAQFARPQQAFVLRWVDIIAKTNAELAYQFARRTPDALKTLDTSGIEDWVIRAMDVYDSNGLYPAVAALDELSQYTQELRARVNGVRFDDVAGVIQLFLQGLSGRELRLKAGEEVYTDTQTLFLPPRLTLFSEARDNFRLYKAMAAHLWAQTWYGTFRLPASGGGVASTAGLLRLSRVGADFEDATKALRVFHALETVRLDARIGAELAGLHKEMAQLQNKLGGVSYPSAWRAAIKRLRRADASVEDSLALLPKLYDAEVPRSLCYQGALFPERVERALSERIAHERNALNVALARLLENLGQDRATAGDDVLERFRVQATYDAQHPERSDFELQLDGKPIVPPDDVHALMASIIQDFGDIPPEYLQAGGDGRHYKRVSARDPADVWRGVYHEEGAFLYNEWDYRRQHYRKNWCVLRELDVHPLDKPFVEDTLKKYSGLVAHLRRTFEALRGENKLLKRQKNGDDIDFDAVVEGYADMRHGMEMTECHFANKHKIDRDIAVMFMVDMSGSTKGWVNNAERESLVLLCEALEILGDRYAIYGFSGTTRKRCELFRVKSFAEPYDHAVKARISGMRPQDYTRMGVIIRHLSRLLKDVDARTKLLITLSDGKPDDYDGYGGDYGIEDTRQALIEAKQLGIHPFCVTIDTEARDYLPHMYGAVNYTLVDKVDTLPLKVADIYRKLTF